MATSTTSRTTPESGGTETTSSAGAPAGTTTTPTSGGTTAPTSGGAAPPDDGKDPAKAARDEAAVLAEATARGANLAQPGAQVGKLSGAMYAEALGQKTVRMMFPQALSVTLQDYTMISFEGGIQDVPESLVDHPYLKAHGVKSA